MINESFKTIIRSETKWYDVDLKSVWAYRDLIFLFVKRNFSTRYKQMVLGPVWLIISPLLGTVISTFVFGTIAGIPTDGIPYFLFYMCGNSLAWSYFANCLTSTSGTFTSNAAVFGKVYFPRLVMPISSVITGLIDFTVHVLMFMIFWFYYKMSGAQINFTWAICLIPLLLVQMAALGLGCGIIISSLTTKYRDLTVLVGFGMSLWMYITPIIYSTTSLSDNLRNLCMMNPMSSVVELFRYAFLGTGEVSLLYWGISWFFTIAVLFVGIVLFNKVEKTFMDTV